MASPPVGTKLFVPPLRSTFVPRARVGERLDHDAKLTLVSAPAGFGKTTALSAWVAAARGVGRSVAWLSCEDSEQQAAVFWSYDVATLQTLGPSVGEGVLPILESAQPSVEAALATLVNDLSDLPYDLDLVLDDYHLAESPDVAEGLRYLLEHLPPNVRLVVSTRVDPDLPLARLRARSELREVRADDLRFTGKEVTAYLRQALGFGLDTWDVDALEQRTEGWIAALQLAALSMQDRPDPRHAEEAIHRALTGDDVTLAWAAALSGLGPGGAGDLATAHQAYTASREGLERSGPCPTCLDARSPSPRSGWPRAGSVTPGPPTSARSRCPRACRSRCAARLTCSWASAKWHSFAAGSTRRGSTCRARWIWGVCRAAAAPLPLAVALAGIREAEGDLVAACDLLADAEHVYQGDFNPNVRPVPAMRARLLVALGRETEARACRSPPPWTVTRRCSASGASP